VLGRLIRRLRSGVHPVAGSWVERRLSSTRLYATLDGARVDTLRARFPPQIAGTIASAERLLQHEFDLLGSGPFVPVDPDRPARNGYTPIDWYLDPVRGLRFPRGVPYKDWKLYEMRPGHADVKYPWELARCQHWAALGQAFVLTGDDRFAHETARELDDFVEANPIGVGINWTCTMDVALRAVNWAIGLELIHASVAIDQAFWVRAYSALFDHAVFIQNNLENTYEVTSNHFLSNIVGLWFLGAVFADMPAGREWLAFARHSLEHELDVQVLPDGADFESSIPYHRLVAELFLGSMRLADFRGEPLSAHYRTRVRDMVAYLAAVSRPDGLMPQVGDADDGRLHVFTICDETTPQDPRHLFGPAAAMFGVPGWRTLAGEAGDWEAAWWGLEAGPEPARTADLPNRLFPEAGIAVMRQGPHFLLATNGVVGTNGFGNHKHNDQLSFEYHCHGVPLIVDPGSYVYTSDFAARNLFRSTSSHNTLEIDGVEQNELKPDWIFRLFETARPEHVSFDADSGVRRYVGRHHGYERLPDPVTHERELQLTPDGSVEVIDRLSGRGSHDLRWHFHFAPGVDVSLPDGGATVRLTAAGRRLTMRLPEGVTTTIASARYSPSYGVARPCAAIDVTAHVALDRPREWKFSVTP